MLTFTDGTLLVDFTRQDKIRTNLDRFTAWLSERHQAELTTNATPMSPVFFGSVHAAVLTALLTCITQGTPLRTHILPADSRTRDFVSPGDSVILYVPGRRDYGVVQAVSLALIKLLQQHDEQDIREEGAKLVTTLEAYQPEIEKRTNISMLIDAIGSNSIPSPMNPALRKMSVSEMIHAATHLTILYTLYLMIVDALLFDHTFSDCANIQVLYEKASVPENTNYCENFSLWQNAVEAAMLRRQGLIRLITNTASVQLQLDAPTYFEQLAQRLTAKKNLPPDCLPAIGLVFHAAFIADHTPSLEFFKDPTLQMYYGMLGKHILSLIALPQPNRTENNPSFKDKVAKLHELLVKKSMCETDAKTDKAKAEYHQYHAKLMFLTGVSGYFNKEKESQFSSDAQKMLLFYWGWLCLFKDESQASLGSEMPALYTLAKENFTCVDSAGSDEEVSDGRLCFFRPAGLWFEQVLSEEAAGPSDATTNSPRMTATWLVPT
ncbi:MAG: hypothetical protein DHS20C10_12910 [marine bacterium B5-7]|nr:MAG: hypothetical protein DHS20C10_12910 [marine bacterium B5-7]